MRKLSVCLSVCLSVRLSVKCVNCDKTEERSVQIFIPHERSFSLVWWEEEWLLGGDPSTWNFGTTGYRWSEIADFQPIFARSASTVTHSEKSSNRKSTTRFPMGLRWFVLEPPKVGSKRKTADFRLKSHFVWRKSAKKFLYVKTVSDKVVRQLWNNDSWGVTPSSRNFGSNWQRWSEIADFLPVSVFHFWWKL